MPIFNPNAIFKVLKGIRRPPSSEKQSLPANVDTVCEEKSVLMVDETSSEVEERAPSLGNGESQKGSCDVPSSDEVRVGSSRDLRPRRLESVEVDVLLSPVVEGGVMEGAVSGKKRPSIAEMKAEM